MKGAPGRALLALVAAAALGGLAAAAHAGDPLNLMPESASAEADMVDGLTYLILWITGVAFVGTQGVLVYFLFRYRAKKGQKAKYTHGNHAIELVWTVTPALILVFLALWQMNLWIKLKSQTPGDGENANPTLVQILAKQFEWNFRYPGPDGQFGTADDRIALALVVPIGHPVNARLRSLDVIHSFYLPNFRFKQDAVPGLDIGIWFKPSKLSVNRLPLMGRIPLPGREEEFNDGVYEWTSKKLIHWDIVCAELCGMNHTTMAANLYVVTDEQYAKWTRDPASVPEIPVQWGIWNKDNPVQAQDQVWLRWDWQTRKFDAQGRVIMKPAELNREPFGEDEQPGGGAEDSAEEDI